MSSLVTVTATAAGAAGTAALSASCTIGRPAVGTNKGAWAAVSAAAGPLRAYRGYVPPSAGVPALWPGNGAAPVPAGALPIVSLNLDVTAVLAGSLDAQLTTYAATVPPGALVTVGAEDEAGRFAWTPLQIRALHACCYRIFKRASPGCLYGQVVTTYTASPASPHYPLATPTTPRWIAGGLDWYGLDCYAFSATDTPAANMGVAIAQMRLAGAAGLWALTEVNTSHGSRPAWFTGCYAYAQQIGAVAFCPWWGSAPYAWDGTDTATVDALRSIATVAVS